jgi:hypothetical protein
MPLVTFLRSLIHPLPLLSYEHPIPYTVSPAARPPTALGSHSCIALPKALYKHKPNIVYQQDVTSIFFSNQDVFLVLHTAQQITAKPNV